MESMPKPGFHHTARDLLLLLLQIPADRRLRKVRYLFICRADSDVVSAFGSHRSLTPFTPDRRLLKRVRLLRRTMNIYLSVAEEGKLQAIPQEIVSIRVH